MSNPLPLKKIELGDKKYTIKQLRDLCQTLISENEFLKTTAECELCGRHLPDSKFYKNNNPDMKSGKRFVCKDCIHEILYPKNEKGEETPPTRDTLITALRYLNKPFFKDVYEDSVKKVGSSRNYTDLAVVYLQRIVSKKYDSLMFCDSDLYNLQFSPDASGQSKNVVTEEASQLAKDRNDLIRLVGYDPFKNEDEADKPFLYSQVLGMLDSNDDSNDDQMKVQSIISIVRSFNQVSKIDDSLSLLMMDLNTMKRNSSEIQKLQDSKSKIQSGITKLAAESCISLKNTKNSSKGDNTWTGKIKKCKDLSLRLAENNGFDLNTCRGMQQVMDMSHQSIMRQLKLDESEYSDMLAEQREMLVKAEKEKAKSDEIARILLRENLDLKDLLEENEIEIVGELVNLDELLTSYDEEGDGQD